MTWWHSFSFSFHSWLCRCPSIICWKAIFPTLYCMFTFVQKKKKTPQQIWYICVCLDSSMINLITCKQKCLFFLFYACVLSHVGLFATQWTEGCQAPLSMGFPRKGYWSGLTFPPPGDSSRARDWTQDSCTSCIGSGVLNHCATWEGPSFAMCKHKYMLVKENSLKKWTA